LGVLRGEERRVCKQKGREKWKEWRAM